MLPYIIKDQLINFISELVRCDEPIIDSFSVLTIHDIIVNKLN